MLFNLPFQDMRGVTELYLTEEQFRFLEAQLKRGMDVHKEQGGLATVQRSSYLCTIVDWYPLPTRYSMKDFLKTDEVEQSQWFQDLLKTLKNQNQKIGFYYHTHPTIETNPSETHEEGETARRTKPHIKDAILSWEDWRIRKRTRRLADIIIEMHPENKIALYCFSPVRKPYHYINPVHRFLEERYTHSVDVMVPELGLCFDSTITR